MIRKKSDDKTKIVNDIVKQSKTKVTDLNKKSSLLPSGADMFDLALGGGFPSGQIVNIIGDKSSCKTLLSSEFIHCVKKKYGKKLKWFYDDVEERYSFNTKKLYGFEMIKKEQENSYTIENFKFNFKNQINKLKEGELLIYVLDSFDGLTSEEELKKEKQKEFSTKEKIKGSYGLDKTKQFGGFFRLRAKDIKNKNVILVVISQVRVNIGVIIAPTYYRTGGKALDHWASVIIWLAEVEKHKKKGRPYGITTKAKITKVGNDKPFRECFIEILFDYGVDNTTSNIMFLYDLKTDKGKNKEKKKLDKLEWNEEVFSLRGLVRHIEKNNLEDELRKRTIDKWNEIEEAISTKGRKSKW